MKRASQLEKAVLDLPAPERARVALAAWESLESDPAFAADPNLDPEGVALALERDAQMESGQAVPLTHSEFRDRTSGAKKK